MALSSCRKAKIVDQKVWNGYRKSSQISYAVPAHVAKGITSGALVLCSAAVWLIISTFENCNISRLHLHVVLDSQVDLIQQIPHRKRKHFKHIVMTEKKHRDSLYTLIIISLTYSNLFCRFCLIVPFPFLYFFLYSINQWNSCLWDTIKKELIKFILIQELCIDIFWWYLQLHNRMKPKRIMNLPILKLLLPDITKKISLLRKYYIAHFGV